MSTNTSKSAAITTTDNPYNPRDEFNQWFVFDVTKGYNTCDYLSRVAHTSDQFSDEENAKEIEKAIDDIIKYDFNNIYTKVYV